MQKKILLINYLLLAFFSQLNMAQNIIPLDTINWEIRAKSYVIENYKGKNAIYIQRGGIFLKNTQFLNGTIEFDIILKESPMFPGVFFRGVNNFRDAEQWYMRTHLSGKPDANQAAASINGVTPWQLYFGSKYSFPYTYNYGVWTHVKLVVNNKRAQVFLDYSEKPNLSWDLFLEPKEGGVMIRGGAEAMHIADIIVNKDVNELKDFVPIERDGIKGLVSEWEVSEMFEESTLNDLGKVKTLISEIGWQGKIKVEEGIAANISRVQLLQKGKPKNTVFTRILINSDKDQLKQFEFGYSDRVVVILNGVPLYKGTNKWRSRDYRYLGTVGLFDNVYLNLKKGTNELLMAVSEDFGGWLITGKFKDNKGLIIK